MNNTVIILAAGSGSRMKSNVNKMLLKICDKTVIERTVETFLKLSNINEIIVTARKEEIDVFSRLISDKKVRFVIGGETRQQSVVNAINTIDETDYVIIHDGARPFVSIDDINNTVNSAYDFDASAVGVPVKDTIKIVDDENIVVSTPRRATLFSVQTPQVFKYILFKKAIDVAEKENLDFTDDCQLIEHIGVKVKMVVGSYDNIKITTPEDIPLGENILNRKGIE